MVHPINTFMNLFEIDSLYTIEELTSYSLCEASIQMNNWIPMESSAFKKGWKKYSKDNRVVEPLKELVTFIDQHQQKPMVSSYPSQFYVHNIRRDKRFDPNVLSAHLKGQKIILLFKPDPPNLYFMHLGTHADLGW